MLNLFFFKFHSKLSLNDFNLIIIQILLTLMNTISLLKYLYNNTINHKTLYLYIKISSYIILFFLIGKLGSHQTESHEDLRLIDTTMSPMSSTTPNSGLASPHHQINTSLNNINAQPIIPTRFTDRRVSAGLVQTDPYKFNVNYSEAGQRLAKKAQEQLKTLEKSKEVPEINGNSDVITTKSLNSRRMSSDNFNMETAPSSIGDDWQNVLIHIHSLIINSQSQLLPPRTLIVAHFYILFYFIRYLKN